MLEYTWQVWGTYQPCLPHRFSAVGAGQRMRRFGSSRRRSSGADVAPLFGWRRLVAQGALSAVGKRRSGGAGVRLPGFAQPGLSPSPPLVAGTLPGRRDFASGGI